MDNLDRTNVVQATIAKWTLNQQLRELGILSGTAGVDDYESFSKDFREGENDSFALCLLYVLLIAALLCSLGGSCRCYSECVRWLRSSQIGFYENEPQNAEGSLGRWR
jgi:hypothetical protein